MSGIYRVSDAWRMQTLLDSVRQTDLSLSQVQQQLATGNRLTTPSVDPVAASSALSLQRVMEAQQQDRTNIDQAMPIFNMTDQTLGDAADLLRQAETTAQANVGTMATADQQRSAADTISELSSQLLEMGNQKLGDTYIFGGTANTSAPFVSQANGIQYVGAEQGVQALVGGESPVQVGLTGDEVFGAMSSQVQGTKDLSPSLATNTRLADMKGAGGAGVELGTIVISDGVNPSVQVDLTGADRIGDVIDRINQACGGAVTASLGPNQDLVLTGSAGANLTVTEQGNGRAAHDLGIYRDTPQGTSITGDNLQPVVTATTPLADLANGAGLDLASGIIITNGGQSQTLSFASDQTVGDLLNRINTAGLGVQARIDANGTSLDIVNCLSGSAMCIGENGGTTAEDLGVRSMDGATSLASLNGGHGVQTISGQADMQITARDGSSFQVNLDGASTVSDVIDKINAAATSAGVAVTAGLAKVGNGIELTDATGGSGDLQVQPLNASEAVDELGLDKNVSANTLTGDDVNAIEPDGVFAHLAQLRQALANGDTSAITKAAQAIASDTQQLVGLRARVGGVVQDLTARQSRSKDQDTANQALLSKLKDTDMAEAVTRFTALQTALQGNMISGAKMLSMSLLDFLQ